MHNVGGKVIELLLSRRQSADIGPGCQGASPFLSRYPDFSPMCRFTVTVIFLCDDFICFQINQIRNIFKKICFDKKINSHVIFVILFVSFYFSIFFSMCFFFRHFFVYFSFANIVKNVSLFINLSIELR